MMNTTYAVIEDGVVTNIILWDNAEIWEPPEGSTVQPVATDVPVAVGWTFANNEFTPPAPAPKPPATLAETLMLRDAYLRDAALRIAPLQDADDLGEATAEEAAALTAWKKYRVALSRIDQQAGFPAAVVWPQQPQ